MTKDDKLPRGHAYIRVRNRGCAVHVDYLVVDSKQAERAMNVLSEILKEPEEPGDPATSSDKAPSILR